MLILLFVSPLAVLAQANAAETATIDKYISAQATREHGEEYPDARKVVAGDLNNDGQSDVIVLYTIEGQNGSNNHVQYLAAFLRKKAQLVAAARASVGGKNYRDVELESIEKGKILLSTLNYARKDPSCCPSKKGSARYVLAAGKLRQVNPK
jgi:hypothetical protein